MAAPPSTRTFVFSTPQVQNLHSQKQFLLTYICWQAAPAPSLSNGPSQLAVEKTASATQFSSGSKSKLQPAMPDVTNNLLSSKAFNNDKLKCKAC